MRLPHLVELACKIDIIAGGATLRYKKRGMVPGAINFFNGDLSMKKLLFSVVLLTAGSVMAADNVQPNSNSQNDIEAIGQRDIRALKKEIDTYCYLYRGSHGETYHKAKKQSMLDSEHFQRWNRWFTSPTKQIHSHAGCRELYAELLKKITTEETR